MNQKEIIDIYKKIGLGTQIERDKYIEWNCEPNNKNEYFFIQFSPTSNLEKEKENA